MQFYAHTRGGPKSSWERLEDHLLDVGNGVPAKALRGASGFAKSFGAAEWGRVLGVWHDLGKYSDAFQAYISARCDSADPHSAELRGRVDHSTAGAQHAVQHFGRAGVGRLLAYCIAGHHAGLPDWVSGSSGLQQRLEKPVEPIIPNAPAHILRQPQPSLPSFDWGKTPQEVAFRVAFFVRMLFSCLVDADFLATEQFMNPQRAAQRSNEHPSFTALLERLDCALTDLQEKSDPTPVNQRRRDVLKACRDQALLPTGLFSLNVPTGGGKTLSSLTFALTHARAHDLRRVIYAIPFTSIIEQTAREFREALDDLSGAVLEHHSNVDPDDSERNSIRLAAENWDSPLIVTTNVQLLDSLFASRTSRCRKLHRIARSVIVLDEAQTLPPDLLAPSLAALDELARNYGCSIVFCTATQPAIEHRDEFPIGLSGVTPIVENGDALHAALRRTDVQMAGRLENEAIAQRLAVEPQVLCIVNSRGHAAELFRQLTMRSPADDCFHLSASMCAAHRQCVVQEIRRRLSADEPCRAISTQVIEAGVDVDFPTVYRARAGLDSIAQAAGRCNREGRRDRGPVVVFDYDENAHRTPPFIRAAADAARQVIPDHRDDLLSPPAIEAYFRLRYWRQGGDDGRGWDRGRGEGNPSVMECFSGKGLECQFRSASERYRLIDDAQTQILVPWSDEGAKLRKELEEMPDEPDPGWLRSWTRRAQRFSVGVFDHSLRTLSENGALLERHGRLYLGNDSGYNEKLGLTLEVIGLNPGDLIQ